MSYDVLIQPKGHVSNENWKECLVMGCGASLAEAKKHCEVSTGRLAWSRSGDGKRWFGYAERPEVSHLEWSENPGLLRVAMILEMGSNHA